MDEITNGVVQESSAPPPPPEVKVRTMRSDLASMAQSGGGLPRFQSVRVEGMSGGRKPGQAGTTGTATKKDTLMITLVVIVGIIAIAAVGYVAYRILSPH